MWKDWLTFSKNQRYGLVILFILVCIAAFFPIIYQVFFFETRTIASSSDIEKVDSFFRTLKYHPTAVADTFSFTREEEPRKSAVELFPFDPNIVTVEQLMLLGFSQKQAQVIVGYRKKGGVFKKPSDFAKMYVVDSLMFKKLLPYINIAPLPEKSFEKSDSTFTKTSPTKIVLELNSADTLSLVKLKGIGPGYARRIVAYRQLLGGYRNVDQLSEIWGFPPELLESIRQNLTVDSTVLQKINVNMVTYQELKKHPYLNEYQAKAIIYYRETKGNISNLDEILKNKLVDKETFRKLKGYLSVE